MVQNRAYVKKTLLSMGQVNHQPHYGYLLHFGIHHVHKDITAVTLVLMGVFGQSLFYNSQRKDLGGDRGLYV